MHRDVLVGLDLCGLLYDTFAANLAVTDGFAAEHGFGPIDRRMLQEALAQPTYNKAWMNLGATEAQAREITQAFDGRYNAYEAEHGCSLVPGAREVVSELERQYGLFFLTNALGDSPRRRFESDGFNRFIPKIVQTPEGKGEALVEIAGGRPVIYVGDTRRDGEAAEYARRHTTSRFVAVASPYSMARRGLLEFALENRHLCTIVTDIRDVPGAVADAAALL